MGVTFTSNLGLAKPDETELAKNWALGTQLADDNNTIIEAATNIPLISYTPTFIGPTTNPSVGAGTIVGQYIEFQGFIFGEFVVTCTDPGVAVGSGGGGYGLSLPTLVDPVFHTVGSTLNDTAGIASCIGDGYITDGGTVSTSGGGAIDVITISGVSYARMFLEAQTTKSGRFFGPTVPFSLATTDRYCGNFQYKKA